MEKIPEEIKQKILSKPLHGQNELAEMLGISGQVLEKARQGRVRYLENLKYTRIGRRILYPSASIVEFIESLQYFSHIRTADERLDNELRG